MYIVYLYKIKNKINKNIYKFFYYKKLIKKK